MPLRDEIQAIVASLPNQPIDFLYGTANEINVDADSVNNPALVCLYPLMPIGIGLGVNGSANNTFDLYMEFIMITKFENQSDDNEGKINQMIELANRFLVYMSKYVRQGEVSQYFKFDKGFKAKAMPIYYSKDSNRCGVSLSFSVSTRFDDYLLPC